MCQLSNCPLSLRDVLMLSAYVNELTEEGQHDPLTMQVPVALLLYDVCIVLSLEAQSVLGEETLARIHTRQMLRLWPTIDSDDFEEKAETDAIREEVHSEWYNSLTEDEKVAMFRRD